MGCGESKHDVATGNTILRRKKSKADPKKSKDIGTVLETYDKDNTTNSSAEKEGKKQSGSAVAADAKDISEVKAVKEGGEVAGQETVGRLISADSPNHFFSSRENEERIEGIIAAEGRPSEDSDFFSPSCHAAGKDCFLTENVKADNTEEEKEMVEEPKAEKGNEEIIKMEQESVVKDAGVPETTVGAKGSRAISEEKNPSTEEEDKADTSTKDVSTK